MYFVVSQFSERFEPSRLDFELSYGCSASPGGPRERRKTTRKSTPRSFATAGRCASYRLTGAGFCVSQTVLSEPSAHGFTRACRYAALRSA